MLQNELCILFLIPKNDFKIKSSSVKKKINENEGGKWKKILLKRK